ncbi:MAG: SGNH/GDSL hydrolase family protein [Myxococcota bacterium]
MHTTRNWKPRPWILGLPLLGSLGATGCTDPRCEDLEALPQGDRVQVIGDSVFDSNADTCGDVGDHLSFLLGEQVVDRAIGGLLLDDPDGLDIADQYRSQGHAWVVVDGGANDLLTRCNCDCGPEIDALASEDASEGAMVDLVDRIVADGSSVAILGYYEAVPGSEFGPCLDELEVMTTRYSMIAEQHPEVTLVDARPLMSPQQTPSAYQEDGIHPSPEGALLIAEAFATVIGEP